MITEVRELLQAVPFEPFIIVTTSGRRYRVPTVDHAGFNPAGNRVVVWFENEGSVIISGLHIATIERSPDRRAA